MDTLSMLSLSLLVVCMVSIVPVSPDASLETLRRAPRVRRVIGGMTIELGQWPWLAHLKGKVPSRTFWGIPLAYRYMYCGGTVINNRWILTAAHCFDGLQRAMTPKYWHIKVGETDATHTVVDRAKSFLGRVFGRDDWRLWYLHATKIVRHPNYNAERMWANDIALVKLEDSLPLGSDPNIGAITLPQYNTSAAWPVEGASCIMKGWGCTSPGGNVQEFARAVRLPVVNTAMCQRTYGGRHFNNRLCAGARLREIGICKGDSGGPLVCMQDNRGWQLAGVASFTSATHPDDYPGVFTRVSNYVRWINDVIANN